MTRLTSMIWTLLACATAAASDPPPPQTTPPSSASAVTPAVPATPEALATATKPEPGPPLDLRIGDVRKYMTPKQFQAAVSRATELDTVLVEAHKPALPVNSEGGVLRRVFWLFAPVVREPPPPREPADKIPPLIFRYP